MSQCSLVRALLARSEMTMRILYDTVPLRAGIAYLFGETAENQASILVRGAKLYHRGAVKKLAIPGLPAVAGFPGCEGWMVELETLGVPRKNVISVPWTSREGSFNTLTEAEDLVSMLTGSGCPSVIIVGAPFHQIRCFLSVLGFVQKRNPRMKIYSLPGVILPWTEEVVHSQGKVRGTRASLIVIEMIMTLVYTLKGDLPRTSVALHYLNERDKA